MANTKGGEMMAELKFKGYCAEHGIKNTDIAKVLGITANSVSRKINGRLPWTLSQVKVLCEKYGISSDIYFR